MAIDEQQAELTAGGSVLVCGIMQAGDAGAVNAIHGGDLYAEGKARYRVKTGWITGQVLSMSAPRL